MLKLRKSGEGSDEVLTEVDMAAFAGYCEAYARWKEAEEFISKHGLNVHSVIFDELHAQPNSVI